jgi:hypothetical protein
MGIINEFHEPNTFNGVERPLIDGIIVPTTWRELGAGITGIFPEISLKYQAYLVNGFMGFDGSPRLSGASGLRKARQKGAHSVVNTPDLAGRIEYFGLSGVSFGLSGYLGRTETSLYNGIDKSNQQAIARSDSSVVGVGMAGFDIRYKKKGFQAKTQLYLLSLENTVQYNQFTSGNSGLNNLGSGMYGYYIEAGYDIFRILTESEQELTPFIRFEKYDLHHKTEGLLSQNPLYEVSSITSGLTFMAAPGAAVKADYQFINKGKGSVKSSSINVGIGLMF